MYKVLVTIIYEANKAVVTSTVLEFPSHRAAVIAIDQLDKYSSSNAIYYNAVPLFRSED